MPAQNTIKTYVENSYYHVYNRGVEKRNIFLDDEDYNFFLHLLKIYLSKPNEEDQLLTRRNLVRPRPVDPISEEIDLLCHCLMPNHFHLLIRQVSARGMETLMRKMSTTYAMYFNEKYERVGSLFQGPYKAVLIDAEPYLLHLSRYIHTNPRELATMTGRNLVSYPYSSYKYYLDESSNACWIEPKPILDLFRRRRSVELTDFSSYQSFVENFHTDAKEFMGNLVLD